MFFVAFLSHDFQSSLLTLGSRSKLRLLSLICSLFGHLAPLIGKMEHEVAGQGLANGFGTSLAVDEDAR